MPTLRELEAHLLKKTAEGSRYVDELKDADGIIFLCPKCFPDIKKSGCHSVICWFEGKVSDDVYPRPGRWTPAGTGLDDLTFVPGAKFKAVSVALGGGCCGWHGFVKNGRAE